MKKHDLLSKIISYALRHVPWEYELELDEEGWIDVDELLAVLRKERHEWQDLSMSNIRQG